MAAEAGLVGGANAARVRTVAALGDVRQERRVGTDLVDARRDVEEVVRAARETALKKKFQGFESCRHFPPNDFESFTLNFKLVVCK